MAIIHRHIRARQARERRADNWLASVLVFAACGNVAPKIPSDAGHDAPGSHDDAPAPGDGMGGMDGVNVMIDAAAMPATAIGASSIPQFTATAGADTKVPYQLDYDDLGEWSNSTSTFTAKYAGDYLVCASLYLTNSFTTGGDLWLYKNGARHSILVQSSGIVSGCRAIRLAASDTLDVEIFIGGSTSLTVMPDANWQWLTIERVTQVTSATTSAAFASPKGQFALVPYDTASVNDGSLFDTSTHQLKPTQAGDYQVCASLVLSAYNLEGELDLFINGTRENTISNGVGVPSGCRSTRLAANDTLDVRFFQNTTNATIPLVNDHADWIDIQQQPMTVSVGPLTAFTTQTQTFQQVPYSTEVFDDSNQFDPTTSTFRAATAGDYQICASLLVPASTMDGDEIDIYKNGTRATGLAFGHFGLSGCRTLRLVAGDQVAIYTYTQGAKSFANDANWDWFEVSKLH